MRAVFHHDTQKYTLLEISPQEAHIFIWGGKPSDCILVEEKFRRALVEAEDNQMTDTEYKRYFMQRSISLEK